MNLEKNVRKREYFNDLNTFSMILTAQRIQNIHFSPILIMEKRISKENLQEKEKYLVSDCYFNCLHSESVGGAISVHSVNVSATIKNCFFFKCTANDHGGGISAECKNFSITTSYFTQCLCPKVVYGGQAFYTDTRIFTMDYSTVDACPSSMDLGGFETVVCRRGMQKIEFINSSNNYAMQYASGWMTSESSSFTFLYFTIVNNSSPNQVLALTQVRPDDEISHANIVRNSAKDGLIYISGSFAILQHFLLLKNNGPLICYTSSMGPAFVILDNCTTDKSKDLLNSNIYVMSEKLMEYGCKERKTFDFHTQQKMNKEELIKSNRIEIPEV